MNTDFYKQYLLKLNLFFISHQLRYIAFSSESLDFYDNCPGSVSSLRRASHSKSRAKHRINDSPSHWTFHK